jgi:phosphatidylinositol alpha-1,6-mannosyltransferase
LPSEDTTVLTTAFVGAARFDAAQPFRVERTSARVLLPTRRLAARINRLAADVDARIVLLDPAVPVGRIGPQLERPYGVIVHGAEVAIPGRLPIVRKQVGAVLRGARLVIAAGGYPAAEAERAAGRSLGPAIVPPGVDADRFRPLGEQRRAEVRARFGIEPDERLIVSVSRLVPRKGMDTLIESSVVLARRHPRLRVLVGGVGRDGRRLQRLVERTRAPVTLIGRVADAELPELYGSADVFGMLCRDRWGGLEAEGFGIVFLEAAACGVPQVAGRSGGSHEAVEHGVTGLVVDDPKSVSATADAIGLILEDDTLRAAMSDASRRRAVEQFTYDALATELQKRLQSVGDAT